VLGDQRTSIRDNTDLESGGAKSTDTNAVNVLLLINQTINKMLGETGERFVQHTRTLSKYQQVSTRGDTQPLLKQLDSCILSFRDGIGASESRIDDVLIRLATQLLFSEAPQRFILVNEVHTLQRALEQTLDVLQQFHTRLEKAPRLGNSFLAIARRLGTSVDHLSQVISRLRDRLTRLERLA